MLDRLPYEIFREIIKSLYVYTSPLKPLNFDKITLPPVETSHVCRSWRIALLSDASLWTCIIIPHTHPHQIHEMLRRSGSAPLHVFVDPVYSRYHRGRLGQLCESTAVFQDIDRFQTLQVIIRNDDQMKEFVYTISSYLNRPAPMPQKFYLSVEGGKWAEKEEFLRGLFSSGNVLNSQHMYREMWVKFHECLRSPGQLFQNLSGLHLELELHEGLRADALLDVIEFSPGLRVLDITSRHSQVLSMFPGRRLYLPRLERLPLSGSCNMMNLVLGHLTFPLENVICSIASDDFHYKRFDLGLFLSFLVQCHFESLEIIRPPFYDQVDLVFSTHSHDPGDLGNSSFSTAYYHFFEPPRNLPNLLQVFDLSVITRLRLSSIPLRTQILHNIFVSLVNLERCHVDHRLGSWYILNASFLMALIPCHAKRQAQLRANLAQETDKSILDFLDIEVSQDADDLQLDSRSSAVCGFPCPSLTVLDINIHSMGWEIDGRYAQLLVGCVEIRQQARHPFDAINIHCWKQSLMGDARAMLQPHEGSPIPIDIKG